MIMLRSRLPLLALALLASTVACSSEKSTPPPAAAPSPTTSETPAPVLTDGTLPADADKQGYLNSFARCTTDERLVLLVGQKSTSTKPFGGFPAGDNRIVVCENKAGVRVMRANAAYLRPDPIEGTFFTFTANSQQFVADGMKIDLAHSTVTITDDPKRPDLSSRSFTLSEYWSAVY